MRHSTRSTQTVVLRLLAPPLLLLSVALAVMVYADLNRAISDAFDRKLATVSALAGALIDPTDHAVLTKIAHRPGIDAAAEEQSAAYRRNVIPLQQIRRQLDLTYVYTQVLGGPGGNLFYVLDGTEGTEHSALGEADTVPPTTFAGLRTVERTGRVYISPVQSQERWGMLKTGAAPIRARDGRTIATAGVDIDISIIRVSTETALFRSAALAVATIAGALLASWFIARQLARPIGRLHAVAMKAAAGGAVAPTLAKPRGAREIGVLAGSLDRIVRRTDAIRQAKEAAGERAWREAVAAHLGAAAHPDAPLTIDGGRRRLVAFAPLGLDAVRAAIWRRGLEELLRSEADDALLIRALAFQPGALVLLTGDALHVAGDWHIGIEGPLGERREARPGDALTAPTESGAIRVTVADGRSAEVVP